MTTNNYYSQIPNVLFYSKDSTSIYIKSKDNRIVRVMDYLWTNVNRNNEIRFTIDDLVVCCGNLPNNRNGKTNAQYINMLQVLSSSGIISELCINEITKMYSCHFSIDMKKYYIQLFESEKSKILAYEEKSINNNNLLLYYCYLKSRIHKGSNKDFAKDSGRADTSWISYETINRDLDFTDKTIKKYNDILIKLNLIRVGNAGHWFYTSDTNKIVKESPNHYYLFTGDETEAKLHLNESIKYYKSLDVNSQKTFIKSRQYKNNNLSLNGRYGALLKKSKNGTITEEEKQKLQTIIDSKFIDEAKMNLKAILDKYPDETLYSIYIDHYGQKDIADKYFEIEQELGLVDSDDNFLVDKKYYDWVMTTYKPDGSNKPYLINCVSKYKRDMYPFGLSEKELIKLA